MWEPKARPGWTILLLILKTIGNRKGDCAWSCSRWQTQPEKICKSQRTNQCHSLRTLYWFVRCDLQIFSGCVCHLEQLHAQSPFLFPIVFSINLIPFFDICSVDYLLFFHLGCSGMCCFTWAAARSQQYTLLSKRQASCLYNHALEHSTGCTRRRVRSTRNGWYWVNHGRLTSEQSCTRTLDRQRTIMHSNTRQALNASTPSVYAKWYWVNHGRLTSERQAHQRTQSLPSATHRHSSITRPCCSSAQAPSFLSFTRAHQRTIMHSNTRQAANNHALEHSTGSERVDAFGLREMVLGKSRQAHQRTAGSPANAKLTFRYPSSLINHSTLLPERSSAKLLVFYASTRSRRAVEVIICMITRDFSVISIDVTGVSLSLSTTHKSHSRTI